MVAEASSSRDTLGVGGSGEGALLTPGEQFEAPLPEVLVAECKEALEVRGGGRRGSSFGLLRVLELEASQLVGGGVPVACWRDCQIQPGGCKSYFVQAALGSPGAAPVAAARAAGGRFTMVGVEKLKIR